MTRIQFYVLGNASTDARLDFACRLTEKAAGKAQKIFIFSSDQPLLHELDERLWGFRPLSFVAHRLLPATHIPGLTDDDPVLLSSGEPANDRSLLINLDSEVPLFFSRFERALEIVNKDPAVQDAGRRRYRFYKQRGYPLTHYSV